MGNGGLATIADVARYAGVATSTVSHVLNGTRFVSVDTSRAVREAVKAVGYTPNTLARALARSTTNTIGLAVSSTTNRYFADVINAVEDECQKLGMMVLLSNTHDEPAREPEGPRELAAELPRGAGRREVGGLEEAPAQAQPEEARVGRERAHEASHARRAAEPEAQARAGCGLVGPHATQQHLLS